MQVGLIVMELEWEDLEVKVALISSIGIKESGWGPVAVAMAVALERTWPVFPEETA